MNSCIASNRGVIRGLPYIGRMHFMPKVKLTTKKIKIIELLSKGYSVKVIAKELNKSPRTIEMHIDHMYQACNIHSRKEFLDLIHQGAHKQFFIEE